MAEKLWPDWYNQIKKNAKSVEEELEICKKWLKFYREEAGLLIHEKPLYVEDLLEELREEGIDVDQTAIEDAFYDLSKMAHILPLCDLVRLCVLKKDRFNLFEKLEIALSALSSLVVPLYSSDDHESIREIWNEYKSGNLSEEQLYLKMRELDGWEKSVGGRLGLSEIFGLDLVYASQFIGGAISLAFLGNTLSSGVLLRSALESGLKGMLIEHLLTPKFRRMAERMGSRDEITFLLKEMKGRARDLNVSLEEVVKWLRSPSELSEVYGINRRTTYGVEPIRLNIYNIMFWLREWNVFHSIPEVEKMLNQYWRWLNQEVHVDVYELAYHWGLRESQQAFFLKEITWVIDLTLVGTLDTVENVTRNSRERLRSLKTLPSYTGKTVYDEFLERLKNGGLKYAKKRLEKLTHA